MQKSYSHIQNASQFSERQVLARKIELWKQRGYAGNSPEEDRAQVIADLEAESFTQKDSEEFDSEDNREFTLKLKQLRLENIKTFTTVIGAVVLYFTYLNTKTEQQLNIGRLNTDRFNAQREQQLNTQRLTTDRFTKAVEQLGHQDTSVRTGGIYALQSIAKDSSDYHWTVVEVLAAFVRERSRLNQVKSPQFTVNETETIPIATDVQAALTAIGRRDISKDFSNGSENSPPQELNLRGANLRGADLRQINLREAKLYKANLQKARLNGAQLGGAILHSANLQEADLAGADLREADFSKANLKKAILERAILEGAENFSSESRVQALFCGTVLPEGRISDRDCKKLGLPEGQRRRMG
jgi:predicted DNA binding CopG/RHH family protein